ncbi:hypothetical protein WA538_002642 [Blastocystis sp. DL]
MGRFLLWASLFPLYRQEGYEAAKYPILWIALALGIAVYGFDLVLDYLQRQKYYETEPPKDVMELVRQIDKEDPSSEGDSLETRVRNSFFKSQLYGQDRMNVHIIHSAFDTVVDVLFMLSGMMPYLYDCSKSVATVIHLESSETAICIIFSVVMSILEDVISLPWSLYSTFVIEEKYGYNKQTLRLFFSDMVKSFLVNMVTMLPLSAVVIFILRRAGPHAYLFVWGAVVLFSILLNMLYPICILPLFNTMTPMEPSPLRDRLFALASAVGFRVSRLQVIDSSQRTGHSNAAAYGFFGVNGILVYDTLLKQLSDDQIVGVVAHELGHWKRGHTYRMLIANALEMFVVLFTANFAIYNADFYHAFGFSDTPVLIGLLLFISMVWSNLSTLLSGVVNAISRKYEYQADAFAVEQGYGLDLKIALTKLNVENASSLSCHWLVDMVRSSHPSFVERCKAISALEKKTQ